MDKYNDDELYSISMKLTGSTIKKIENIQNILNQDNKAQTIASTIIFMNFLLLNIKNGDKVYIDKSDGTTQIINFKGL